MKINYSHFTLTLLAGFLIATSVAHSADRILPYAAKVKPTYVEGEVLIKFKRNIDQSQQLQIASVLNTQPLKRIGRQQRIMRVRLAEDQSVEQAVSAYRLDPNVEHVQPNYLYYTTAVPNDTEYGQLWGLKNTGQTITNPVYRTNNPPGVSTALNDIDAELAWDVTTDCSSAVVAVLDTGIDYTQQDLASNMWDGGAAYPNHGYDFIDSDNDPIPIGSEEIHGTHVAGTIGSRGDNGQGTTGVCWQASLMSVRVCDDLGICPSSALIPGIEFAYTHGAKVINMSLAGPSFDPGVYAEIRDARDNDVVVVTAAGNGYPGANNDATPAYPCNYVTETTTTVLTYPALDNTVCVAALDQGYNLTTFSNYGLTNVSIGAPGVNILSGYPGKKIIDTLSSGWTTTGGWTMTTCYTINFLVNPADWCFDSTYAQGTDDRAYKEFDLSDAAAATVQYYALIDTEINVDYFRTAYKNDGGDPFPVPSVGTLLQESTGSNYNYTGPNWDPNTPIPWIFRHDLAGCLTANCSIGFQLESAGYLESDNYFEPEGIAIYYYLIIDALELSANKYRLLNGTSMATPHVAGVAALVGAYNPDYTYADTVTAIKEGGEDVEALATTIATGKAANAMGSLSYINPPTGVTAVVQ